MAKKKTDASAEAKIKDAARKLFIQKGFAATRTREIADEAGINLALLNYYFGGKQKLFEIIMQEILFGFLENISTIFKNPDTSLEAKIQMVTQTYISFLLERPDLPIFILSELRNEKKDFFEQAAGKLDPKNSVFFEQVKAKYGDETSGVDIENHVLMNLVSLIMFPILGAPMIKLILGLDEKDYESELKKREDLIPEWMEKMFLNTEKIGE